MIENRTFRYGWLIEFGVISAFAVFYFAWTLTHFDHNDFMYATIAHSSGRLYRDIHYVQAPFGYYFWHTLAAISPQGRSYPFFRIVSAGIGFSSILLLAFKFIPVRPMRLVFFALVASSADLLSAGGEIGTYSLAIFFVSIGYAVLFTRLSAPLRYGLAALAIGLAASSKLNHVFLIIPLVYLIYAERRQINFTASLAGTATGGLLGVSTCLYLFLLAPKAFVLHNFTFHTVLMISAVNNGVFGAIKTIPRVFLPFASVHAVACVLGVYAIACCGRWRDRCGVFFLWAAAAALIMAFLPIRMFIQYLAPAALLIFVLYCRGVLSIMSAQRKFYLIPALTIAAVGIVDNGQFLMHYLIYSYMGVVPTIDQVIKTNDTLRLFRKNHALCDDRIFSLEGALVDDSGFRLSHNMEGGVFWQLLAGHVPQRYFNDPDYKIDQALIDPAGWILGSGVRFWVIGNYPDSTTERKLAEIAHEDGYATVPLPDFGVNRMSLLFDPGCVREKVQD